MAYLAPSVNAALPPHPRLQTSYPLPPTSYLLTLHPLYRLMFLAASLYFLLPLTPLTPSGFFKEMLGVLEPEALHFYTLSRLIPLTLFVFLDTNKILQESNLNSSSSCRIPRFSALQSDRIHSRSGILSTDAYER